MKNLELFNDQELLTSLSVGNTIVGSYVKDDYWHYDVFFKFLSGEIVRFSTEEHCLEHLFDCYTLLVEKPKQAEISFTSIAPPFKVSKLASLRRAEWIVAAPELEGQTLGNNPHSHETGVVDAVPENAIFSVKLTAGLLIVSDDDRKMIVKASELAPLNVDLIQDEKQIEELLKSHTIGVECVA